MRVCAAKLRREKLASAAKFLEFYAVKFCACRDKIYNAFLRGKICGALLAGRFCAARCGKIRIVKYGAEFCSTACRDKIYGVMADDKIFGTALAGAGNLELQNSCVNLRPRNTYEDLKFKGSVNFEPSGGVNFKFKNSASFRFLCGGNARLLKSRSWANALSLSAAAEISALIRAGEILKYGVTAGISALTLASKILIPSATGKILSLSAVPRTDFGLKGAGGC